MLRSNWIRALVVGLAMGLGAGAAMAKPVGGTVCVDTCNNRLCQICANAYTTLECYVSCINRFPSC